MFDDLSSFSTLLSWFPTIGTTFVVIFLAELGDKTQIVCMTLAARYRPWPVFWGALLAFVVLNVVAVLFGATLSNWLPRNVMIIIVAVMFGLFGIQALRASDEEEDEEGVAAKSGRSVVISAFLLIFVAELGDKTQIAVAGMASTAAAIPVWIGSTLALGASSALGVALGRTLLQKIPLKMLSRVTGIFFLALALLALTRLEW